MREHGGINVELLVARVKEKYPEAKARIIHDNGRQFVSKDFKSLMYTLVRKVLIKNGIIQTHVQLQSFPVMEIIKLL